MKLMMDESKHADGSARPSIKKWIQMTSEGNHSEVRSFRSD